MSSKTAWIFAACLALVHVCLAFWYADITPYRTSGRVFSERGAPVRDVGAPDERPHVNYVMRLVAGKGFPFFDPKDPNLEENIEGHQPPAFYVLGAGWSILTGARDLEARDSGIKLRALDCLLGGLDVIAVFCLGFWGLGKAEVGVLAAAFAALLPMNVALSGAVNNDVLLFLLCTAVLALSAKAIRSGWAPKVSLAVGVALALALLTKTTALSLMPAVLFAVLIRKESRPKGPALACLLVPLLLLPLPWWIRNQMLYGDPFALTAFNQAFVNNPHAQVFINDPDIGLVGYLTSWVGWWTIRSFFGAFGYMDIWLNETGSPVGSAHNLLYRLLIALSVVVLCGWLVSWKKVEGRDARSVQVMNVVYFGIVTLLFLRFNLQYFQAQARYLFPAIGPIACGYALGTLVLTKNRWPLALGLLVLVLGGTTLYAGNRLPSEFEKRTSPG